MTNTINGIESLCSSRTTSKPLESRHLNIEKDQIRRVARDGRERLAAVVALADDVDAVDIREAQAQSAPRQRLVVDDQRTHRLAHDVSKGIRTHT